MPTDDPLPIVLPPLRGEESYARYLDELETEARSRGIQVRNRSGLVEYALNILGFQWGLKPPRRCRPNHRPRLPGRGD